MRRLSQQRVRSSIPPHPTNESATGMNNVMALWGYLSKNIGKKKNNMAPDEQCHGLRYLLKSTEKTLMALDEQCHGFRYLSQNSESKH